MRILQTRLDFKVSRLACTRGIRETGSDGERRTALHEDDCDRTCLRASVRLHRRTLRSCLWPSGGWIGS